MRIAEYKQIDTKRVENKIPILDDDGNETGKFDAIVEETPVMGMVYRDATKEEIAEMERATSEIPIEEPTQADRIEAQVMYTALMTDTLLEEN